MSDAIQVVLWLIMLAILVWVFVRKGRAKPKE
jgi:hypothetical protein